MDSEQKPVPPAADRDADAEPGDGRVSTPVPPLTTIVTAKTPAETTPPSSPPPTPTPTTPPPAAPPPKELTPGGYYWVIGLAGFAALIYAVIGARHLQLIWGNAPYAQTAATATILLATAAGAAVGARVSPHLPRPFTGWTAVQILIALITVYFNEIFTVTRDWGFDFILPNIQSAATAHLFKWGLGITVFGLPAFLLGAAPAFFAANLTRLWQPEAARTLTALFAAALTGLFIGMVFCYFLPAHIGLSAMMPLAGIVIFIGIVCVWIWSHRYDDVGAPVTAAAQNGTRTAPDTVRRESLLTLVAFITGLALLIYTVVWQRTMALLSAAAQPVWDITTAVTLAGLAIGAALMLRHKSEPLLSLARVKSVTGVIALSLLFVFLLFERLHANLLPALIRDGFGFILYLTALWGIAAVLVLPTAIAVGMSLPLLARALTAQIGEAGSGRVLAALLAGAAVGTTLATHILLPNAGLKYALITGALLDMAMGITLLGFLTNRTEATNHFVAAAGLLITAVFFGNADIRHRFNDIIFYRDGAAATAVVTENDETRSLFINSRPRISVSDASHSRAGSGDVLTALLPLLYKPDAGHILNIGLGNPLTARTLLTSGNLRLLDSTESSPALIAALPTLFGQNNIAWFSDPRHRIHTDDAQALLPQQRNTYDIIISQPHFRWQPVAANQLTEEFYAAAAAALKPDGILTQRISFRDADGHLLATAINALSRAFEQFNLYAGDNADLIIIAGKQKTLPPTLNAIFASDNARRFLSDYYFYSAADADILYLGNKKRLRPYFSWFSELANSAHYPAVADRALATRFKKDYLPLEQITFLPLPLADLTGSGSTYNIDNVRTSPYSPLRQKAGAAREIYEQRRNKDGDIGQLLATLPADACPNTDAANAEVLTAVNDLFNRLLPFINKNKMADIWRVLENNDCLADILRQDYTVTAPYLRFWRALSLRDSEEIITTTTVLLPHTNITGASGHIFTLAKMAAHYQQGDFEAMLETEELYPLTLPAFRQAALLLIAEVAL